MLEDQEHIEMEAAPLCIVLFQQMRFVRLVMTEFFKFSIFQFISARSILLNHCLPVILATLKSDSVGSVRLLNAAVCM